MNIAIIGTGYVGLVSGACFAELGATVTCIDTDATKIATLRRGEMPIYEPNLQELVSRNVASERLHFSTQITDCLDDVQIVFIAVGTPPDANGNADLRYILEVGRTIGAHLTRPLLVVTKSTVPVGTSHQIRSVIDQELAKRGVDVVVDIASNPEFLKEGDAIDDFMKPDRVVVGVDSQRAQDLMTRLYKPMMLNNFRVIFMDIASAEMTKYASNAMLATRISFMNDIANVCELVGADVDMVRKGMGSDSRIGSKFLYPGCGYGGSCFPKDIQALIRTSATAGYDMRVLRAVEEVNERQKSVLFDKFFKHFKGDINGRHVAIWGLSFKPGTDDMRQAPSLVLIQSLLSAGCTVTAYDPVAMDECRSIIGEKIKYAKDMYEAVLDADALFHVTEWKEFRMPAWEVIKRSMHHGLVIDGRNVYSAAEIGGMDYIRIG